MLFCMHHVSRTMSTQRKIKWILDAIEHILKAQDDRVLMYNYFDFFRAKFALLLEDTFNYVENIYIHKDTSELNFRDIRLHVRDLVQEWDENDSFLVTGDLFAKVRHVNILLHLLDLLLQNDVYDGKLWTITFHDGAFYNEISDSGGQNPDSRHEVTENPESDDYIFEYLMNPEKVDENPTKRRVPIPKNPGEYRDPYYDIHDNPPTVREMLCRLDHYI
jgi:hypothetical protein